MESRANNKKNILIYAHYYYPDVASTGQILTDLAEGISGDFNVTVICTVPSYTGIIDSRYKSKRYYLEKINGVHVVRVRVPEFDKTSSYSRIRNIVSYFFAAIRATKKVGTQDYVYTISQPPVLGGLLGVIGSRIKRAKLIYNIQDFNPEQIRAVEFTKNKLILRAMMHLDKYSCRQADKIIVVGRDMVGTLKSRFGSKVPPYIHINNWINEKEIVPLSGDDAGVLRFKEKYGLSSKFVFMYSGNIGLYYDLLGIQKVIARFSDLTDVVFAFVGQGTVLEEMKSYCRNNELSNMVFIPYQDKEDLVYSLNAGDVHFVVNANGIKGVSVPSKIDGVMAAGKPVLGILEKGSEARMILEESGCGIVSEPEDYEAFEKNIRYFIDSRTNGSLQEMGLKGREYLEQNLTKDLSIRKYSEVIKSL